MQVVKEFIGRAEEVTFPTFSKSMVIPARVDTGAKTSSIWASQISEHPDGLHFRLFAKKSDYYKNKQFVTKDFEIRTIASSIGEPQDRYVVKLTIKIAGKRIRGRFSLADRSKQAYPVLVGRNVLRGKFVVDVAEGSPDYRLEKKRHQELSKPRRTHENRNSI